jgi:hypothetical protein
MQPAASRPIGRALMAAAVFVFAAAIAPLCALMVACSMPCCEGKSFPFVQSTAAAACAEHCAITSNATSHELPNALAPSSETAKMALASLAVAETSVDIAPAPPPRLPAFSVESHHAVPGDAPVYLYNSAFLI